MTIGTRVDSISGPVSSNNAAGLTIAKDTSNVGFGPFPVESATAITSATTLTPGNAGVLTVSSSAALTNILPTAASCPGAEFIFRNLSAHAHIITSSQETAGVTAIVSGASFVGAKITMAATVGAAVILKSDGVHFTVIGNFLNNPAT